MINTDCSHNYWLNAIGFNIAWLGLVALGNMFIPIAMLLLAVHIKCYNKSRHELHFIWSFSVIGVLVDSVLSFLNVFIFNNDVFLPLWLPMLWLLFSATINHSLHFLNRHYTWQFIIGAIFGPLSYIAGHKLGAVGFGLSANHTFIILSAIWGPLFILCFALNRMILKCIGKPNVNIRITHA